MAKPVPGGSSASKEKTVADAPDRPPLAGESNEASLRAQINDLNHAELVSMVRAARRNRWQQGNRSPVEAYLAEFPSVKADELAVLDLIMDEMQLREDQGEKPDIEEYTARFPDLAARLRRQFALRRMLDTSISVHSPALKGTGDTDSFGPQRAAGPVVDTGKPEVEGYEILGELGRGGMGVVYKARQLKLGRLVALKMILAGVHAGSEDHIRFRTEAEAVASLQHPNIVQIYEVGEQSGRPYFSLEYVNGGNLADKLDNGKVFPPDEAARLIETLARAIQAAHEKGFIHRDLKPGNVLLTMDGVPKITDFGLAKRLDSDKGQTRSGAVMGTPSYMAPEQASGNTREVGALSDVYALGAMLYELLTARPPFLAESPMDTMFQVINDEPVPPRRLQPKIPADLETICLKCLEKSPKRRYGSAGALADDLRLYLEGEPIMARPIGYGERAVKWARRRPGEAVVLALMLLAGSGLAIVTLTSFWNTARLIHSRDWVEHTYEVIAQAQKVLSLVKDAETGQRGYLLTRDPCYLQPYEDARHRIHPALDQLVELTEDNPNQLPRIEAVRRKIDEKLEEMQKTIDLRREKSDRTAALRVVRTNQGKLAMDEIRTLIREIQSEERDLLVQRTQEVESSTRMTWAVLWAGLGLVGLLVLAPILLFAGPRLGRFLHRS